VTDRQAHALANPVADPAMVSAAGAGLHRQRRHAQGMLTTILSVNR
jgi:hypothetical protein